jgi:hypothetical protein
MNIKYKNNRNKLIKPAVEKVVIIAAIIIII